MIITKFLQKYGYDTIDTSFYSKIEEWKSWYRSNVRRFHSYKIYSGEKYINCKRGAMGMAKKLSEDIADLLLNEHVAITINDEHTSEYVKDVLKKNNWQVLGNTYQEKKAALGTVAYVPYITNAMANEETGELIAGHGEVKIDYVAADNIYPLSWSNDYIEECAFVFPKTYKTKEYAVIQIHAIENGEYVIYNHVVETTKGSGTEVEQALWKDMVPFRNLTPAIHTGSSKRQFVIDKLNVANNFDEDNPMGIAIYANAIDQLKGCDTAYDSYVNEFVLGKKRIYVSHDVMQETIGGNKQFDPDDVVFYKLPEENMDDKKPIVESNMEIRAEAHNKGINDFLNILSVKTGFGTEHYKFENGNITTATQVISENSDMYRTIKKHEIILNNVIIELIAIICRLGNSIGAGVDEEAEVNIDFDDSIIEDKDTIRKEDRNDVSMGVMSLAEYRAKYYGETLEEAQKKLPEQETVLE